MRAAIPPTDSASLRNSQISWRFPRHHVPGAGARLRQAQLCKQLGWTPPCQLAMDPMSTRRGAGDDAKVYVLDALVRGQQARLFHQQHLQCLDLDLVRYRTIKRDRGQKRRMFPSVVEEWRWGWVAATSRGAGWQGLVSIRAIAQALCLAFRRSQGQSTTSPAKGTWVEDEMKGHSPMLSWKTTASASGQYY